jgi:prevent-host-death family protein
MTQRIGAREARNRFADLMGLVHYGKQSIIVDRAGRPMVAIIPVEVYQQLVAERDARFEVLERIRGRLPEVAPEEVDRDVSQAISAVRAAESARQTPSHPPADD